MNRLNTPFQQRICHRCLTCGNQFSFTGLQRHQEHCGKKPPVDLDIFRRNPNTKEQRR
jgi:hypothetical protein